jgi:allophanate hydrolase subunit 2
MASAKVVSKYNIFSIQDEGRKIYRKYGIPTSGPMIQSYARQSNLFLGNDSNEAVIEFYNRPFKLIFEEQCLISIVGHTGFVLVNDKEIQSHLISINANDVVEIPYHIYDAWKYIGVKYGWQTEQVLGSRCTSSYLGMSINNELQYFSSKVNVADVSFHRNKSNYEIEIYEAPESSILNPNIWIGEFTISNKSNRMAYVLNEKIEVNNYQEINSAGVFPGIIQLTSSGEVYILMKDGQVTGGYPRIGYLNEKGLENLASFPIGSKVKFKLKV